MPSYPWLLSEATDYELLPKRIEVQRRLGVPYPAQSAEEIIASARKEAEGIAADLATAGEAVAADRAIVPMIAYLQRLGRLTAQPVPVATAPQARVESNQSGERNVQ